MLPSISDRHLLKEFVEICQKAIGQYVFAELDEKCLMSFIRNEMPRVDSQVALLVYQGLVSDVKRRLETGADTWRGRTPVESLDRRVELALLLIYRFPASPVQIADAAIQIGISRSRLSHLVTKQTGFSWGVRVRNARLRRAAQLLVQTALSIKEITAAVGYAYASSFDRDFRKFYGCRPSDFRRSK